MTREKALFADSDMKIEDMDKEKQMNTCFSNVKAIFLV